jgi:hypothetical protein
MIDISFFKKFKSLAIHLRNICKRIYISKIYIAIDEIMIAYREPFNYIIKFSNKSISERYKVWTLAKYDYI